MSFSSKVRNELASGAVGGIPRHCLLAEIAAFLASSGQLDYSGVSISTENRLLAKRFESLANEAFGQATSVSVHCQRLAGGKSSRRVYSCSMFGSKPFIQSIASELLDESLLARECCKRAYIRGAFLSDGSTNDPTKHYHLEFVSTDKAAITLLRETISHFDIDMRVTLRKSAHVLYVKDGERIAWLLNIIGAHKSLMEMENVRIVKEIRNNINRKVNFETANLSKTVNAAVSQEADINYIVENGETLLLSQNLADVAKLRLAYPSASLKEIGEMLSPVISKSAVNHRLRKISAIADKLRGENV